MSSLSHYIKKFSRLRRAKIGGEAAPHKPILILAIMMGIETEEINENRITITPNLVARFKDLWHQLVHTSTFTSNFSLPFYHLKSDGFWFLHTCPGREILLTTSQSIKSFAQLKDVVAYASFPEDLYGLMKDPHTRAVLRQTLLSTYFPSVKNIDPANELISTIVQQILNEPAADYIAKSASFDEEEIFVRGGVFKKEIPRIYNYTCCISGMRIITDKDVQMIDACHIVPFAQCGDDTITNGISLCPNLHRAFDRGLISISGDYRVLVKPFYEAEESVYTIGQYAGKQILVPKELKHRPIAENLLMHRNKFGFE